MLQTSHSSADEPTLSVVWIGSEGGPYLASHALALSERGLVIEPSSAERAPGIAADVRILPVWAFDRTERLAAEYPLDPRPTLLLGKTAEDVDDLLWLARNSDEVGHAGEGPATVARRVARLAGRAESYRQAQQAKDRDSLTGLWNRVRFINELNRLLEESVPIAGAVGLLLLDLDHFKRINDAYGHPAGDRVLSAAASAIRRGLKPTDFAARWGGEEFLVLLPRSDEASILRDAEVIRRLIGGVDISTRGSRDVSIDVCASAGVALHRIGWSAEDWIKRADMALYQAKSDGRDRLVTYESLESPQEDEVRDLQVRHFQNVTRVVSERVANMISLMGEQIVQSVRRDADQDALTGVNNRRYFDKRMAREFELAARHGLPLTLLFLDIDNFGQFNRDYGAPTGDAVLRQFAETVSAAIRPVDWIARYGGEEFCVVMPARLDEALVAAERLRQIVAESDLVTFDRQCVRITASIGVAEHGDLAEAPAALVQRASKALQEAKRLGRNQVLPATL